MFRETLRSRTTAVKVRVTPVLLNYRPVRTNGQRVRCHLVSEALSNGNAGGGFERALDENVERCGQGFTFSLGYGGLFAEETRREFGPSGRGGRGRVRSVAEDEGVGTIEDDSGRILEVVFGGIYHGEVEIGLQELQQRIAFENEWSELGVVCIKSFLQRGAQEREALGEKTLFGAEPEGAAGSCGQKTGAISASIGAGFPADGADVLVGSAIAIVAVLGADAVAVLGDFSGDPVRLRKCGDHVTDQLRFANAAGVAADDDDSPVGRLRCFTSWQVWPLAP